MKHETLETAISEWAKRQARRVSPEQVSADLEAFRQSLDAVREGSWIRQNSKEPAAVTFELYRGPGYWILTDDRPGPDGTRLVRVLGRRTEFDELFADALEALDRHVPAELRAWPFTRHQERCLEAAGFEPTSGRAR